MTPEDVSDYRPTTYEASDGSLYVHKDLVQVRDVRTHAFGDAESWAAYVKAHRPVDLLVWNSKGLRAEYDPFLVASCLFEQSREWRLWLAFANDAAWPHKAAIEKLEDLGATISDPDETALMGLLRTLKANVTAEATTEVRQDGTTSVTFAQSNAVRGGGAVELPPFFGITIPILRGEPPYKLRVRLRASVGSDAHLALRFALPDAEAALEDAINGAAGIVPRAKELLGDGYAILRAAG